jgi:hypothetical protein
VLNFHTVLITFLSLSLLLFLPRASRLQAASLRGIVQMQVGQCGRKIGTEYWEVSPTHTQTEGRPPVRGSEFTTKVLMSAQRGLGDCD